MSRKRSGRNISGWILIDKPAGPSSSDIVNKVRWLFGAQKAGHSGTLDPEATGLLAIALGEATKTIPYVTDSLKAYTFDVCLGSETTTDDQEGETTRTSSIRPTTQEIQESLNNFTGHILQTPPKFSAVKVNGQRAYKLARENIDVELAPRPLFVKSLDLVCRKDSETVTFEMICGKGGYVRSIARDLGRKLECYGHIIKLRRQWSGSFDISNATTLEELKSLKETNEIITAVLPLEASLVNIPEIAFDIENAKKILNGNPCYTHVSEISDGQEAWASENGKAIALGKYLNKQFYPSRIILPSNV